MGRKPKVSYEDKIKACEDYLNGTASAREIAEHLKLGIEGSRTVRRWAATYRASGPQTLCGAANYLRFWNHFICRYLDHLAHAKSCYLPFMQIGCWRELYLTTQQRPAMPAGDRSYCASTRDSIIFFFWTRFLGCHNHHLEECMIQNYIWLAKHVPLKMYSLFV